jgi:hypothetical protein
MTKGKNQVYATIEETVIEYKNNFKTIFIFLERMARIRKRPKSFSG